MKYMFFLLFSLPAYAQEGNKLSCDSLPKKPYSFLYREADLITEGKIINANEFKNGGSYEVQSLFNHKGLDPGFYLSQEKNAQWFPFAKDEVYVFLVFNNYADKVFTPCIIFGKKDSMKGIIQYAQDDCLGPRPANAGACERIMIEVCGCNGVTYGNACEAHAMGVKHWTPGRCPSEK